jgi:hypothetical protein
MGISNPDRPAVRGGQGAPPSGDSHPNVQAASVLVGFVRAADPGCRRLYGRVGAWAQANNAEIAYTPTTASWLNRIETKFTALRCLPYRQRRPMEQESTIRRYIIWHNNHAHDERLRIIDRRT